MKRKKTGGVWKFLEESGVLENGTATDIAAMRKKYWNEYKRRWKHEKRTTYTLSFTIEESKELIGAAKKHRAAPTAFIKQALLAYTRSAFVVPDITAVQDIRLLLAKNYLLLQDLLENRPLDEHITAMLLQRMYILETSVLSHLEQPLPVELYIAHLVAEKPAYRQRLLQVLQSNEL